MSCNHESRGEAESCLDPDTAASRVDTQSVSGEQYFDYSATSLPGQYTDTAYALFSNDEQQDRFTIYVPAGLISETTTTILITSVHGDTIYEHIFPTRDLVNGYAIAEIKSDIEMQRHVLTQAQDILQNGLYTAADLADDSYLNQAAEEDFENYAVFTALQASNRVLLHYCLNEESHYFLGYSQEAGKTVTLINCC